MSDIQLEEAVETLLKNTKALGETEEVEIIEALSLILAEDIYAPFPNPPFDRSPLDGFALNHSATLGASKESPCEIVVVSEIMAGDFYREKVPPHSAVMIMTGAPIPRGCDCVIRQEEVQYDKGENLLKVFKELKRHDNYCFKGEDYKKEDLMIASGERLTSNHIGLLASLGIDRVRVYKRPVVSIMSSGDELVSPGKKLGDGQIYNSNLYLLGSRLRELGCRVILHPFIKDEVLDAAKYIKEHFHTSDLFITTGGVSVGKKDIMHEVIQELGFKKLFWRVDIQPGTPVLASISEGKILLSLSGNPFAALVNFELLGRPLLSKMSRGLVRPSRRIRTLLSEGEFPKKSKRRRFVRASYTDGTLSLDTVKHSSGQISSTLNKNALIDIEAGRLGLVPGDEVEVLIID